MRVRKYVELTGGERYFIIPESQTACIVDATDFTDAKSSSTKTAYGHMSVKRFSDNFPGDSDTVEVYLDSIPVSVEGDGWQEYKPVKKKLPGPADGDSGC